VVCIAMPSILGSTVHLEFLEQHSLQQDYNNIVTHAYISSSS